MRNKYSKKRVFVTIPLEIETDCSNVYFEVKDVPVTHYPERPMPMCSDPNKDAYYDPGDPEENEFEDIDEVKSDLRELFNKEIDILKEKFEEQLEKLDGIDLHERLPEDMNSDEY